MPTSKKGGRGKNLFASPTWRLVPWLVVAVLALAAALWFLFGGGAAGSKLALDARLTELAAERGVQPEAIEADDPIRKVDGVFVRTWKISFPNREARDGFVGDLEIEGVARKAVVVFPEDLSSQEVRMRMGLDAEAFDLRLKVSAPKQPTPPPTPAPTAVPTPTKRPQPAPDARGRLAILLDDGGQSLDLVSAAAALPPEIGFAILPFLPYSAETATELYRAGHEVWLHLPMEPEGYPDNNPGPGAVLIAMSADELRTTVGVNNHMGSKATASLRFMTWIMLELKARGMKFIDSRTTVHTVAEDAARAQGVPTNRRHVFLDNDREPRLIRRQLEEAIYRCRLEGEIIAIGHLAPTTLEVLADELPRISARGADLVRPSDLVK
jgi:polysaccharide deacetylase 2 family uncharacterized protein YibQ